MTLNNIFNSLMDANFDLIIQTIINDDDVILFDDSACYIDDKDYEIFNWNINYMWAEDSKIIMELEFEGEESKIEEYKIKIS